MEVINGYLEKEAQVTIKKRFDLVPETERQE
jgi:hypothetical protein